MEIALRIKNMYESLFKVYNFQTSASKKILSSALSHLGIDAGDSGYGNEVDCAISVNNVVHKAINEYVGGDISTTRMYYALKSSPRWIQVDKPLAGDIVISPTEGRKIGHVGIFGYGDSILSNNSNTGKFDAHFRLNRWTDYYGKKGLPTYFYRHI